MRAVIQAVSSASVRVNGGEPRPIGPGLVIGLRDGHRISGIFQIHKIDAFYNPAIFHIKAGDDSFRKHQQPPPSSSAKFFKI